MAKKNNKNQSRRYITQAEGGRYITQAEGGRYITQAEADSMKFLAESMLSLVHKIRSRDESFQIMTWTYNAESLDKKKRGKRRG